MQKKILKYLGLSYFAFLIFLLSAWSVWYVMSEGKRLPKLLADSILQLAQLPSKAFHLFAYGSDLRKIINKTDYSYISQNYDKSNSGYQLLLSTFSENDSLQIKTINIKDFSVTSMWYLNKDIIYKSKKLSIQDPARLLHPLMLQDSSIIFSSNSLFKLDKNNSIIWLNNSRVFHHAIENQGDSLIWTGSRIRGNNYFNYLIDTLVNDAICSVNIASGLVTFEKSIADILVENKYMALLQIGKHESDLIHLNDIQPVSKSGKFWNAGDLFISIRNRNTIFLYRPHTNKVIWLKTGPWIAQHDVDIVDGKTIMVFGNDVIRGRSTDHLAHGHNDIYFYDFEKDSIFTPYTTMMKKLNISTITEGRCDLLPNGDLFIDETNNGKLYIITPDSLKMKYVERIDDSHIKMFNLARPIFN